jgi:pimeloyl-ACP methyl ester carboxylesterase
MKNYVLVHGGWEGSFFWENIKDALIEKGHKAKLVDLPGSYGNEQAIDKITLENYVTETIKVINEFDEKVILVGHSLAGIIISDVAEKISKKIEKLIYVPAPLLKDGESLIELMQSDKQGQMLPRVVFSEDMSYGSVDEDTWREVAFHDVKEEIILDILLKMADKQESEPFMTKEKLSEEHFGSVPKV